MVKVILNLSVAVLATWFFYQIFYFRIIPRLVQHFRRSEKFSRKQDALIAKAKKGEGL